MVSLSPPLTLSVKSFLFVLYSAVEAPTIFSMQMDQCWFCPLSLSLSLLSLSLSLALSLQRDLKECGKRNFSACKKERRSRAPAEIGSLFSFLRFWLSPQAKGKEGDFGEGAFAWWFVSRERKSKILAKKRLQPRNRRENSVDGILLPGKHNRSLRAKLKLWKSGEKGSLSLLLSLYHL